MHRFCRAPAQRRRVVFLPIESYAYGLAATPRSCHPPHTNQTVMLRTTNLPILLASGTDPSVQMSLSAIQRMVSGDPRSDVPASPNDR